MRKILALIHADPLHCGNCEHRVNTWCPIFRTVLAVFPCQIPERMIIELEYQRSMYCMDGEARVRDLEDVFTARAGQH